MSKEIKEVLIKAKNIILEKGWCQGRYVDDNGCVCLSEAIQQAAPFPLNYIPAHNFIQELLGEKVHEYNDRPSTTKENVLTTLDIAVSKSD